MSPGEISLDVTMVDLALGHGGAFSTLRFQEQNDKTITIMNQADSVPAARCKSCGYFIIITDPEYTDTKCIVCNALMPAGTSSCPNCGWTYREE